MNTRETGWEGVDWIHLAQYKNQCRCEHDIEPPGYIKGGEFLQ